MKTIGRFTYIAAALAGLLGLSDTAQGQTNAFTFTPAAPLSFSTPVGLSPGPQTLTLGTTGAPVTFAVAIAGTNCQINVQSLTNVTPATISFYPQTASLAAGTYYCSADFTATGLALASLPITITVGSGSGGGTFSVTPTTLNMSAQTGSTPVTANLTLSNSNPGTPVSFTASPSSSGWLQLNPSSGQTPPNNIIQVQASPAGLAAGTYNGSITITPSSGAAIVVQVVFTVAGNPTLQVQQGGASVTGVNFAYQTGTTLPAPQSLSLTSSSTTTPLSCTVSQTGGSTYLVVSPTGTITTPSTLSLQIASTAATLAPGNYTGASVTIYCPGATNATTTIPVNLLVSSQPLLVLGAPPSAFAYQMGAANPASQTVQLSTTSTALAYSVSTTQGAGLNWLSVQPAAGTASLTQPQNLTVSVNPAGLTSGTYTGTVTVTATGAGNSPLSFNVRLDVSNSTLLGATPGALTYTYQAATGAVAPAAQTVTVSTTGIPLAYTVTATPNSCGTGWLTTSLASGNTGATGSTFTVSVNPAGLTPPQTCTGTIGISSTGAPNAVSIPVTFLISANPILTLSASALNFTGQVGGGQTATQVLALTSSSPATSLTFTVLNPAPWLTVTPNSGSTPGNIQISANTSSIGLVAGVNTTTLTITSPSLPAAINVPVTLTLTSNATITLTPATLSFTQAAGGAAPAPQTLNIGLTGGSGNATFSAVAQPNFGSWLSVTPASGNAPGQISVTVNGATLSQGTYTGQIVVTVPGAANSPQTVNVSLTVAPATTLTVSATSLTFTTAIGASTPPPSQTFTVTSSPTAATFSVGTSTTSCPGFLSATPTSATTPATITVGVNVANLSAITCNGSITLSGNGIQSQTVNVTLTVGSAQVPQVTTVSNGASFIPGAVAPGEIITVWGSNLGPTTLTTATVNPDNTYPTKVADTEVLFDGTSAPILFVRNDQVAVVVPFQVAGRFQTNIQVKRSGQLSNQLQQRVDVTAPGLFTIPSVGTGQGAIVNQNGSINSVSAPAAKGSVVSLYITGAGQTDPQGVTGAVNSLTVLNSIMAPVTVNIGGQGATVQYAGGAPGNIQGLYQINVVVPKTAGSGNQAVQILVGTNPSQGSVTMAIQ